jgi:hypothetical protein
MSVLHTLFEQFSIGGSIVPTDIWYSDVEWSVMWPAVCVTQTRFSLGRMNLVCAYTILHTKFDVHMAVHSNIISIVKPTRCTNV